MVAGTRVIKTPAKLQSSEDPLKENTVFHGARNSRFTIIKNIPKLEDPLKENTAFHGARKSRYTSTR
jgi:hypothetical protein